MSIETAAERASRLMDEVGQSAQATYTKGEVRTILNAISAMGVAAESMVTVDRLRRGDVFVWKLVGGKTRPWVTLSCRGGVAVAVAMSSGDKAPLMHASECRFWPGCYIGCTVAMFDEAEVRRTVSRPYTNHRHLREIEAALGNAFSLPRPVRRRKQAPKLRSVA